MVRTLSSFVLCNLKSTYFRLLMGCLDRPPSREESRVGEVETAHPTKGSTLWGENFATLAISKSTLKPKMSIGPYSLARVLQVGWWTLGVPQWLHCVRERIPKAPNAHCLIRDLGKSWKLAKERPGRCQLRWTPGRATWQRLGFNNRSSKAGNTSSSSIYIGSNVAMSRRYRISQGKKV